MAKHLIWVYGSLKRYHARHRYLQNQLYLGIGITEPSFRMYQLSAGHPAMIEVITHDASGILKDIGSGILKDVGDSIQGELYEIDDECLKELDRVEAVEHGLYERKYIKFSQMNLAFLPTDEKVFADYKNSQAQAYIYKKSVEGAKLCGNFWSNL